jgi:hypothetical protein
MSHNISIARLFTYRHAEVCMPSHYLKLIVAVSINVIAMVNIVIYLFHYFALELKSVLKCGAGEVQSVWRLATDWTTGRSRFDSRQRQEIFPLNSVSRPSLGPTQPPVQWTPWILSPRVKRGRGVTLITHPHVVPRSRVGVIHPLPICASIGELWDCLTFFLLSMALSECRSPCVVSVVVAWW